MIEWDRMESLVKLETHIERVRTQLDILVPGDRTVCGEVDALKESPVLPSLEDTSTGKVGQVYDTGSTVRIANPDSVAVSRFDFGWSGHSPFLRCRQELIIHPQPRYGPESGG